MKKIQKPAKNNFPKFIFVLVGIAVVIVILTFYQLHRTPQTPYALPDYDKIPWRPEKPSSAYALLSPNTPDEDIIYTEGIETTGEDINNEPESFYTYYDQALTKDGFEKINLVGDPKTNTYWVASYKKNKYYIEVQYYVTPEDKNTKTAMLFSGILPN